MGIRHQVVAAAALLLSCGGSSGPGADEPTEESEPALSEKEAERREAVEKLDRYQAAACERVCPRLTECSEKRAREEDPAALEGVPIEQLRKRHTEKCLADCTGKPMSLRQVEIFYECPEREDTCEGLLACLDEARPDGESRARP